MLLDTRIWIWSLLEPERLESKVLQALRSERNEVWLSPISTWEFLILVERGRVVLRMEPDAWLEEVAELAPMNEAPITHEIARASRLVDLPHQDPADRILAATAKLLDLTLVTADRRLTRCSGLKVLPN